MKKTERFVCQLVPHSLGNIVFDTEEEAKDWMKGMAGFIQRQWLGTDGIWYPDQTYGIYPLFVH